MLRNDGFHNSTSKIPLRPCCFKRLVSLMLLLILLRIWLGAFLPGYFRDPVFRPAQIYVPRTTPRDVSDYVVGRSAPRVNVTRIDVIRALLRSPSSSLTNANYNNTLSSHDYFDQHLI